MLDINPQHLLEIKAILQEYAPGVTVKAFGSRVKGTAQPFSDLDLLLIDKCAIPVSQMNELKLAFSNSQLPIMIDLVDWHDISTEFQQAIEAECITL
ncbi:MAG: nucleotidyltransferase domain-containing protein [Legionellales bacterium]|nr:nucleotidyltransferase domain-containing protein [Legionellales bacterium]